LVDRQLTVEDVSLRQRVDPLGSGGIRIWRSMMASRIPGERGDGVYDPIGERLALVVHVVPARAYGAWPPNTLRMAARGCQRRVGQGRHDRRQERAGRGRPYFASSCPLEVLDGRAQVDIGRIGDAHRLLSNAA
jgi:hypothetical protein